MLNIAVVGATGLVGNEMIREIQRLICTEYKLTLLASARSKGKVLTINDVQYPVQELTEETDFSQFDYAIFSAGGDISRHYAPLFANKGCIVVDNSSAFRFNDQCSLIVPEINLDTYAGMSRIIANPNCSTIQSVLAIAPLTNLQIETIDYVTYQSVSGSGVRGIYELETSINNFYPKPITNNVIPQIDRFLENGNTFEEQKMIDETIKILNLSDVEITATCSRVPVFYGHGVNIKVTFASTIDYNQVRKLLVDTPAITYLQDYDQYITQLEVAETEHVYVSRIRQVGRRSISMFVVANNIKKGAATNSVQIVKEIIEKEQNA